MKTYFSKRDISICAGANPIKFQDVTNGYKYIARNRDEETLIEALDLFKRGVIYIIDMGEQQKVDTREIPVTNDKDEEDMEIVSGVTKCTDALAFLKARWPEAKDLRSRSSILAFAESKRVSFPDLPTQ